MSEKKCDFHSMKEEDKEKVENNFAFSFLYVNLQQFNYQFRY